MTAPRIHFRTLPLAFVARDRGGLFVDGDWIESKDICEEGVKYLTTGNVGVGEFREQGSGYISEETFSNLRCTEVLPGDILISRLNLPVGRACIVPELNRRLVTSVDNVIVRPSDAFDRQFLVYLLSTPLHLETTSNLARGTTMQRISRSALGRIRLSIPDLPTQKRIAAFLDRETARIDELITKKAQLNEAQKLRLHSKLQEMVLGGASVQRGLDGNWLQGLPEGWVLTPLKYLVSVMGGATPSKEREDFWIGDIPWVSPKDMKADVIFDVTDHVSEAALAGSAIQIIPENAVLIVVRGMILARTVPVCRLGVPATINQDMKALLPNRKSIRGDYLQRMLQGFSDILMSLIEEAAHGTKKLRSDAFFGLKFPVPPLDVQNQITEEYERTRVYSGKMREVTLTSIDRLREYRTALITAAVTGQIDVDTYGKTGTTSATLERIEEEMSS